MNFPTTRVQPEQITFTEGDAPMVHITASYGHPPYQRAEAPFHTETASSEDNEYTPPLTLLGYVLAFIFAIASIAFSAGYWLNLY